MMYGHVFKYEYYSLNISYIVYRVGNWVLHTIT